MALTTVYCVYPQYVTVGGLGINLLPGAYSDIELKDAISLEAQGIVFICDNVKPKGMKDEYLSADTKTKTSNGARESTDKPSKSKRLPKNRRKRRRRANRDNSKKRGKKT